MILNVVNCYNNEEEVKRYSINLSMQKDSEKLVLVIVVNKTTYEKNAFIELFNNVKLEIKVYYPGENLGYLNGMVYGFLQFCKQACERIDWVIFSNTDIEFMDNYFLYHLITTNYPQDIWLLGPSIRQQSTGAYGNPMRKNRYTYIDLRIREICFKSSFLTNLMNLYYIHRRKSNVSTKEESQYVYAVHGSFMILKPELILKIAKKGKWLLLYAEENYIAEIVLENGKKTFYDSLFEVRHMCGTVTSAVLSNEKRKMQAKGIEKIRRLFY